MGKHAGDPKKVKTLTPEKPQQDSTQGGDGKHTKPSKPGSKK